MFAARSRVFDQAAMRRIGCRDVDDIDEITQRVDIRDGDEATRTREFARDGIGIADRDEPRVDECA